MVDVLIGLGRSKFISDITLILGLVVIYPQIESNTRVLEIVTGISVGTVIGVILYLSGVYERRD